MSPALARLLPRLLVAAGLTAYILWRSDPRAVLAAAAGADWRPMAAAVLLVLLDRALMAYRWVVLLCTVDAALRPSLGALLRIFFVSTFVGTFLPASVGGDAVRALQPREAERPRRRRGGVGLHGSDPRRRVAAADGVDRAAARPRDRRQHADPVRARRCRRTLRADHAVGLQPAQRPDGGRICREAAVRDGAETRGHRVLESIRKYAAYPRQLVNVLVCSMAVQGLRIVQAYCLGRGLGIDAPLTIYFAFIPLILLVMLLPVTFNGIGTSQAAFVWFFAQAGVDAATAFALSVLFVALGIVGNLPGGILYASGHLRPRPDRVRS